MVVGARVAELGIRDANGDLVLLLAPRKYAVGRSDNGELDKFGLYTAVVQTHRVSATVSVDEPLAQVTGHFDVDVVVAHNIRGGMVTNAKVQYFPLACIERETRLRFVIW